MTYQFIQLVQASANSANASTSTPFPISPNPGDALIVAYTYTAATKQSISITDNVGKNTYVPIINLYDPTTQVEVGFWYCASADGGSTSYFSNSSGSLTRRGICVLEYAGLEPSIVPLGSAMNMNVNPGSGSNACVSGTAGTAYLGSYMSFGLTCNTSAIDAQSSSAGSGFTTRSAIWNFGGGTSLGRPEDQRVTSPASNTATFTATTGTDSFMSAVILFAESNIIGKTFYSMP